MVLPSALVRRVGRQDGGSNVELVRHGDDGRYRQSHKRSYLPAQPAQTAQVQCPSETVVVAATGQNGPDIARAQTEVLRQFRVTDFRRVGVIPHCEGGDAFIHVLGWRRGVMVATPPVLEMASY